MSLTAKTESPVVLTIEDGVALIELNNPAQRNILSVPLAEALTTAIDTAERDDTVRVLVVTGRGSAFCGGADLSDLIAAGEGNTDAVHKVYEGFGRLADCTKPTIAAVNGPAVGAGMNLALACDLRIAGEGARFDCRFLSIGIHQGGGHAWMLARAVSRQTASAMLLLGQAVDANEALRLGLVWSVVPGDGLLAATRKLAARAARAPIALLHDMKDTLSTTPTLPTRAEAMAIETERQLASLKSPEAVAMISGLRASISTKGD